MVGEENCTSKIIQRLDKFHPDKTVRQNEKRDYMRYEGNFTAGRLKINKNDKKNDLRGYFYVQLVSLWQGGAVMHWHSGWWSSG